MRITLFATAILSATVLVSPAATYLDADDGPADDGARMHRLAEGVYAIVHRDATTEWPGGATDWPHGNTGVIVSDEGVVVVDSTYLPSRARADLALIRAMTDKPVRYLVNTHWHGDHTHGNGVYRAAFPGLAVVGPVESREYIELNLSRAPKAITAPGSATRTTLAELEMLLAQGVDRDRKPLSGDARTSLEQNIRQRRIELDDLAKVEVVPPDTLFERELTFVLGGRRIVLRNWGRANSPADVTVYLPRERVLFTGDIVVHPVPYAMSSHPLPWVSVLDGIEALPVTALVPGHGPVMPDHQVHASGAGAVRGRARTRRGAGTRGKHLRPGGERSEPRGLQGTVRRQRGPDGCPILGLLDQEGASRALVAVPRRLSLLAQSARRALRPHAGGVVASTP